MEAPIDVTAGGSTPPPEQQDPAVQAADQPDVFQREKPEPDEARAALVKRMQKGIILDKSHWEDKAFKRMRMSTTYVREGASPAWKAKGLYVANICIRHAQQKIASLYAKNPTVRVDRPKTLDFQVWDGSAATLQAAAMDPMNPQSQTLIADVQQGAMRRKMLDALGQTVQIVAQQQINIQSPPFKISMKKTLARSIVCGVGYTKLAYTRHMEPSPEIIAQTSNLEARLAFIESLMADCADDEMDEMDADAEQLKLALAELQEQPLQVSDEGLRFDFPKSWAIIPDRNLQDLRGFQGCDYVTEEMLLSKRQVQEMFGVDLSGAGVVDYHPIEDKAIVYGGINGDVDTDQRRVNVWCCYHRRDGLVYWMVQGYADFLSEPAPPTITLRRFYPWFALTLNVTEDDKNPFPPSDIELILDQQNEYNRARQGLRDHRIAARPKWATSRGVLSDDDLKALTEADAHEVVQLDGLTPEQKIDDRLQMVKHAGIDQAMYDVSQVFQDVQRIVGTSPADLGAPAGTTATENSIAENAHMASDASNADDLDVFLSEIMVAAGDVLLMEMDPATVKKIAGAGAIWPHLDPTDIIGNVLLDIEAGSSGRPNKAADVRNFQQLAPLIMQMPGVNPEWMVKQAVTRLDDRLDPSDAVLDGVPSMMAMARIHAEQAMGAPYPGSTQPGDPAQSGHPPTGQPSPSAAPGAQGPQGAMNTPAPPGAQQTPPARPAPGPGNVPMGGRQ